MSHGLTSEEVSTKLNRMSDEQVHQMAALADKVPAGGDAGLGIVVAILVIVALVLLIVFLYKMGIRGRDREESILSECSKFYH